MSSLRFQMNDRVVASHMPDGTGVLLHLDTKFYYTLNTTGSFLAQRLEKGPATREDLVDALVGEFECSQDRANTDVDAWLGQLTSESLLRRVD